MRDERDEARAFAEELRGKRTGYTYPNLARMLRRSGCVVAGEGGSHRTWSHPGLAAHLTLKDNGTRELLIAYLVDTRKYLEQIAQLPPNAPGR